MPIANAIHRDLAIQKPAQEHRSTLRIERRQEHGLPTNEEARIRELQRAGRPVACEIVDTSANRFRVRVADALVPGALVQIFTSAVIIMAEVRHCRRSENGFEIGLAIESEIPIPNSNGDLLYGGKYMG